MFNNYFDSVKCMNLPGRIDRRTQSESEFAKIGATVDFVNSFYPHEIEISKNGIEPPYQALNKTLIDILDDAIANNVERLLIFEDDVLFTDDAQVVYTEALKELPDDWDVFYLGFREDFKANPKISEHIRIIFRAHLGHAFAVHRRIMPAWRDLMMNMDVYNDLCLASLYRNSTYRAYATFPGIAYQSQGFSNTRFSDSNNSAIS